MFFGFCTKSIEPDVQNPMRPTVRGTATEDTLARPGTGPGPQIYGQTATRSAATAHGGLLTARTARAKVSGIVLPAKSSYCMPNQSKVSSNKKEINKKIKPREIFANAALPAVTVGTEE